jgi:3-oxoadipate enol-lactonase
MLGEDALALADELKIAHFHFCGLSLGGMVGQWLGVQAPERLRSLVLCNTAARVGTSEGWNARIQKVRAGGMAAVTEDVLRRWYTDDFRMEHPEVLQATRGALLATNPEGYIATCAAVRDMDQRDQIASISASTLIVYGTEDAVTTAQDAEFLAAAIPGATTLSLRAAHLSNIEAAQAFTNGVLNFLSGG